MAKCHGCDEERSKKKVSVSGEPKPHLHYAHKKKLVKMRQRKVELFCSGNVYIVTYLEANRVKNAILNITKRQMQNIEILIKVYMSFLLPILLIYTDVDAKKRQTKMLPTANKLFSHIFLCHAHCCRKYLLLPTCDMTNKY